MADKTKIAILGGGMGALTAAYYLTSQPGWEQNYEITLYQLGWRLGGKCASSRNLEIGDRIEEHGLHVWFGFYENAFRLVRQCYAELNQPPGSPLATVEEAFAACDSTPMMEQQTGDIWPLVFPQLPGKPGEATEEWEPWCVLQELVEFVAEQVNEFLDIAPVQDRADQAVPEELVRLLDKKLRAAIPLAPSAVVRHLQLRRVWGLVTEKRRSTKLHLALALMRSLDPAEAPHAREHHELVIQLVEDFRHWFHEQMQEEIPEAVGMRRLWHVIDLGIAVLIGVLEEDVLRKGLSAIDDNDFRDWLRGYTVRPESADSTPIRALYDCCFAYEDGDLNQPNFAAGVALGCLLRIGFMYRGSVLYLMQAGMGETVISPLYQVLAKRGVRFRFFHKVEALEASDDGQSIACVQLAVQAHEKNSEYQPLCSVNGLGCWPTEPLYDQLEEGQELKEQCIDLESWWTPWKDRGHCTLEAGRDFDWVVLGISLGGLGPICESLMSANGSWAEMIEQIPTMQTQSVQLWLSRTLAELGWRGVAPAMVAAPEPLDVWADMSHLLRRESWPFDQMPRSIQYLCGPLEGNCMAQPCTDPTVPEQARQQVHAETVGWLNSYARVIWPLAGGSQGFNWRLLYCLRATSGTERLDQQWLRANIDPSERYVLSPKGKTRCRLPAGQSGFTNLVLAGDWTYNAINSGCVEAAVMSGMEASQAICGSPETIYGKDFLQG